MRRARPATARRHRQLSSLPGALVSLGVFMALSLAAGHAGAQDTAPAAPELRPNWLITPSAAIDGTYTNNALLQPVKKTDFVTRLSPGVKLNGRSARAEGNLNYQWHQFAYSAKSAANSLQKELAADGKLELIDQWLFLEGSHNTSRRQVSVFAAQTANSQPSDQNSTETAAYRFSPYIQGQLGGIADYQLRYSGTRTRSANGALAGGSAVTTNAWNGRLSGATKLARVGWSLTNDTQSVSQNTGADSRSDRLLATLDFELDPQLRLLASVGSESDNFSSTAVRKNTSRGLGLDWAPTERTKLSLKRDKRTFGNSYSIDFNHRTELSAWRFSDSRDVRVTTPTLAQAATGGAYDLVYQQLTSQFPNPAERAAEATRQLAAAGIAADLPTFNRLLTSQVFLERRQLASVALMGANNTVIFALDRSNSETLGGRTGIVDDFALSQSIRQLGFNASWAHKLTPDATLTLNARTGRSQGQASLDTTFQTWSLQFSTKLGAKTTAGLGLRQSRSTTTGGTGYDETAATGSMQIDF